jgi:hypothetical protein
LVYDALAYEFVVGQILLVNGQPHTGLGIGIHVEDLTVEFGLGKVMQNYFPGDDAIRITHLCVSRGNINAKWTTRKLAGKGPSTFWQGEVLRENILFTNAGLTKAFALDGKTKRVILTHPDLTGLYEKQRTKQSHVLVRTKQGELLADKIRALHA